MERHSNSHRFKYVIFDLGNTLFYFNGSLREALMEGYQDVARTLARLGYIDEPTVFLNRFMMQMEAYMREREATYIEQTSLAVLRRALQEFRPGDIPADTLRTAINALYRVSETHWEMEEDALPCLETLKTEGYRLGLISNAADAQDAHFLINKGEIGAYFDQVIISAEFGLRKPHPKIFHKALNHWQARPDEAVMVGDTLNADILGAQKVKMPAVWITRRAEKPVYAPHGVAIEPDESISTLGELPGVLRNWS